MTLGFFAFEGHTRRIGKERLNRVFVPGVFNENVHNDVKEVEQDPFAALAAFDVSKIRAGVPHIVADGFRDRSCMRAARPVTNHNIVGVRDDASHIDDTNRESFQGISTVCDRQRQSLDRIVGIDGRQRCIGRFGAQLHGPSQSAEKETPPRNGRQYFYLLGEGEHVRNTLVRRWNVR